MNFDYSIGGMTDLCQRLEAVRRRIQAACQQHQRDDNEVQLLAVSKTQSIEAVNAVWRCGQTRFGENYAQELLEKSTALAQAEWHFIGALQSNKSRLVAEHASWVHGIDRIKIAERLSAQRPDHLPALQCLIQVNIDLESNKNGVTLDELPALIDAIRELPTLRLRGLMAIPLATDNECEQRRSFAAMRQAFDEHRSDEHWDTLSMGMSQDLEAAIAEGSTLVRIGTAIFGPRQYA